jgi:hypothetical protein
MHEEAKVTKCYLIMKWRFVNACIFIFIFIYVFQQCFIYRLSDYTVSEDAGIEPRTVATLALTARRSNHFARSYLMFLYCIQKSI